MYVSFWVGSRRPRMWRKEAKKNMNEISLLALERVLGFVHDWRLTRLVCRRWRDATPLGAMRLRSRIDDATAERVHSVLQRTTSVELAHCTQLADNTVAALLDALASSVRELSLVGLPCVARRSVVRLSLSLPATVYCVLTVLHCLHVCRRRALGGSCSCARSTSLSATSCLPKRCCMLRV